MARDEQICEAVITVNNELGLHVRPAARLVKLANQFVSTITLQMVDFPENEADCRSVLSMLMLAAPNGASLRVITSGTDASEALSAVVDFFNNKFGED